MHSSGPQTIWDYSALCLSIISRKPWWLTSSWLSLALGSSTSAQQQLLNIIYSTALQSHIIEKSSSSLHPLSPGKALLPGALKPSILHRGEALPGWVLQVSLLPSCREPPSVYVDWGPHPSVAPCKDVGALPLRKEVGAGHCQPTVKGFICKSEVR